MSDQVVVTLKIGNVNRDYALPLNVKMGELCPRLLAVLHSSDPDIMRQVSWICLQREDGFLTDESATLADYGVRDGAILTVSMEG